MMEIFSVDFLLKMVVAIPFGIGAILFISLGVRRMERFLYFDYRGNSKERFIDNLISSALVIFGATCLIPLWFLFLEGKLYWVLLPLSLCFSLLILPIAVLGAYWQSFITKKLWGGFMPLTRAKYGFSQPNEKEQIEFDMSKLNIPRKTKIKAAIAAISIFFFSYALLHMVAWNGSYVTGILFKLLASGLLAFSVFITILSSSFSRRIQKLRDGETLDDDR